MGGASVSRPFTFTAATTCGQTLTATFQLQDGATNLGNVTFTFLTGALGAPVTATYSTGNIAVPIADLSTVDIPINIADTGLVSDVNAKVRLNHTFDSDLVLQLVGPDGTIVPLAQNRGVGGDNFGSGANDCSGTPTVFDDAGATAISAGVAPFAGTFRPESPLSAFNGIPVTGGWKLRVTDTQPVDTGTVGCVQLMITRQPIVCCVTPLALVSAQSQRVHGGAGTFDLALSLVATNPTTEPRQGPAQTVVLTFNRAITGATAAITEGTATAGVPTFNGNNVVVNLTGVNNQQYVTVSLTNISDSGGGTGGSASVRIGFLAGDVNQNRVVTVADVGLVNAQLAQAVTAANFLKDVNATGTLTVGDKAIANANLTKALPAP